jgi:6-phosphogluconolactonase
MFWKNNDMVALGIKQVVQHWERNAKDKRATRSYGSFSQTESLCCLADLGNDKVYSYEYNPNSANAQY